MVLFPSLAETIELRNHLLRDIMDDSIPPTLMQAARTELRRLDNRILSMSNRTRINIEQVDTFPRPDPFLPEPAPRTLPSRSMWASNGAYPDETETYKTQTGKRCCAYNE